MKKSLVGLLMAALMSLGLIQAATSTAHATPYPGTVPTHNNASAPSKVKKNHRATISVSVTVDSSVGDFKPTGTVTCSVPRVGYSATQDYTGGTIAFTTGRLRKKGTYTFSCAYSATPGSIFQNSSASGAFKVKKKHHRHHHR